MKQFLAQGVLNDALSGLADRAAMQEWAAKNGMGVSDRLVDSEIAKQSAFQGPDGKFNDAVYRVPRPARPDRRGRAQVDHAEPDRPPGALAGVGRRRHARLGRGALCRDAQGKREGDIAFLPSLAFAGKDKPSDAVLATYYKANAARYQQPERRTDALC
jgi:peptidyl-prolyl cis-trans isomerase D